MSAERPAFYVPDNLKRPPDPILGLSRLFEQDPRPEKIDAGVGVYRGKDGVTYRPPAVIKAWENLELGSADYLNPSGNEEFLGDPRFLRVTANLVFGRHASELLDSGKLVAVGTPGGTGAVALMADAFKAIYPNSPILVGIPTWPNHLQTAESRGLSVIKYPHMENNKYDIERHLEEIKESPSGTLVLFHTGQTHNPTGVNPTTEGEWRIIAKAMDGRKAFFDTPYAGFGDGLVPDTEAIRIFLEEEVPLAVAMSYSKNGGIYNERAGALLIPVSTQPQALDLQRVLNAFARVQYSSPSAFGERLMTEVLASPELFSQWNNDLAEAANDLKTRRQIMASILPEFKFVTEQTGLFSTLPLQPEQVKRLREKHAVYMVGARANIGGVIPKDMPRFAQAIRAVI